MLDRYLFTGITSIHGWPVFNYFSTRFPSTQLCGIRSPKMRIPEANNIHACCITDKDRLFLIKKEFRPTHVIHCAGVCDLDVCEERPSWAYSMNTLGSQIVTEQFGEKCKIIYMSSDLVFSGNNISEKGYDERAHPDPLSMAGKTIAAAEEEIKKCDNHLVLRLGLPIGQSMTGSKGAIDFVDRRLRRNLPVTLFFDEWRSCIPCGDIARATMEAIDGDFRGVFHLGGPQKLSLYEIGMWILNKKNYNPQFLKGIKRAEEKNGPPRMGDVSLNSSKIQNLLSFKLSNPFD